MNGRMSMHWHLPCLFVEHICVTSICTSMPSLFFFTLSQSTRCEARCHRHLYRINSICSHRTCMCGGRIQQMLRYLTTVCAFVTKAWMSYSQNKHADYADLKCSRPSRSWKHLSFFLFMIWFIFGFISPSLPYSMPCALIIITPKEKWWFEFVPYCDGNNAIK